MALITTTTTIVVTVVVAAQRSLYLIADLAELTVTQWFYMLLQFAIEYEDFLVICLK